MAGGVGTQHPQLTIQDKIPKKPVLWNDLLVHCKDLSLGLV